MMTKAQGPRLRVAAYQRTSTDQQELLLQQGALASALRAHPEWNVVRYADEAQSGGKESRPRFDRMMKDIRAGKFDLVWCYRFDRLSRTLKQLIEVMDELKSLNVGLISACEQVDTTTPAGKLQFHIIGALAEFERSMTQARITDSIAARKAAGRKVGNGYGATPEQEQQITILYLAHVSLRQIAKRTGVALTTVHRLTRKIARPLIDDVELERLRAQAAVEGVPMAAGEGFAPVVEETK